MAFGPLGFVQIFRPKVCQLTETLVNFPFLETKLS